MTDPHYFGGKGGRHVEMGKHVGQHLKKSPSLTWSYSVTSTKYHKAPARASNLIHDLDVMTLSRLQYFFPATSGRRGHFRLRMDVLT